MNAEEIIKLVLRERSIDDKAKGVCWSIANRAAELGIAEGRRLERNSWLGAILPVIKMEAIK